MKNLNYLKTLAMAFVGLLFVTACDNDDDHTPPPTSLNIVETAQSAGLNILVQAAIKANLDAALVAEGNKTVLAPTDAAFTAFLTDNGFSSLSEVPTAVLKQILLNHIIDGTNITSKDLIGKTGYANTLAEGPNSNKLSIYYDGGNNSVIFNGSSKVQTADIMASNGIVHVVDKVIALPTIATFATTNPALSTLVDALAYADSGEPTVPYIATVSDANTGPFTVFAPTNGAFDLLLEELNVTALSEIPTSTVDAVLLQHIVNANVPSNNLQTGNITTLGGAITANATDFTLTDTNARVSNIVTTLVDIQATNGVVHVIDKVLLP
ncbi:fasciclin domain-containing protein [Mariniflexile ostreae]|uniref:Fasciclin domain-containing protein n=1 Tax=Mariniflexile ostreae TaxID=1520892 RepID=A0ABV5FC26_9FLAO